MLQIDVFLLLSCEDLICSHCTNPNKLQAFCPLHEQQCLGETLETAATALRSIRAILPNEDVVETETESGSLVEQLCEKVMTEIAGGRERMRKFRMKSERFSCGTEEENGPLGKLRERFKHEYDFRPKSHTDAVDWQSSVLHSVQDSQVICKVCFRLNPDNLKVCPGCLERDYQIIWKCRACLTLNQNGSVVCLQCKRADQFQMQMFGKRQQDH